MYITFYFISFLLYFILYYVYRRLVHRVPRLLPNAFWDRLQPPVCLQIMYICMYYVYFRFFLYIPFFIRFLFNLCIRDVVTSKFPWCGTIKVWMEYMVTFKLWLLHEFSPTLGIVMIVLLEIKRNKYLERCN